MPLLTVSPRVSDLDLEIVFRNGIPGYGVQKKARE